MGTELKTCIYAGVIVSIIVILGYSLSKVPVEWLVITGFVVLLSVCGGIPILIFLTLKHYHLKTEKHDVGPYGSVLHQRGKFHEFSPTYPTITHADNSGMHVYHHSAQISTQVPGYGTEDDEVKVSELHNPELTGPGKPDNLEQALSLYNKGSKGERSLGKAMGISPYQAGKFITQLRTLGRIK